jgi:AcrR family transcriptional regulator
MQVLKKEAREKIIKSARKEFRKNGFRRASMRTISISADMTVGNLYRYFRNKEALFGTIIEPLKTALEDLRARAEEPLPDVRALLLKIRDLQSSFTEEWIMLFQGARGTRFEKVVKRFEEGLQGAFGRILERNGRPRELARPVAAAVLTGLSVITGHDGRSDVAVSFIDSMVMAVS